MTGFLKYVLSREHPNVCWMSVGRASERGAVSDEKLRC